MVSDNREEVKVELRRMVERAGESFASQMTPPAGPAFTLVAAYNPLINHGETTSGGSEVGLPVALDIAVADCLSELFTVAMSCAFREPTEERMAKRRERAMAAVERLLALHP